MFPMRCWTSCASDSYAPAGGSHTRCEWDYGAKLSDVRELCDHSLTLAQNDPPAGVAAWIVEKFRSWAEHTLDVDDVITNLMFYRAPAIVGSAARIYWEHRHDRVARALSPVRMPTAIASFPAAPFMMPRSVVETRYDVVRWTDLPAGGNFAALEQPAVLADDMPESSRRSERAT